MKILLYDIETAPNLAYVWGKYQQDVVSFAQEWYMMSWSAKWLGKKTIVKALPDYEGYRRNPLDDSKLVKELWGLFNEADVIIGHNGDKFDIKKTNTRFIENGLPPPSPYKTLDTRKIARKYFGFSSNKLDDLGQRLGVGRKAPTGGFELWQRCLRGDLKAWAKMKKYNKQDVVLLEKVYLKFLPWITNHPSVSQKDCPNCGAKANKRGFSYTRKKTYQRFNCVNCRHWFQEAV